MDLKKYNKLDPVLHGISKQLKLSGDSKKKSNEQLIQVLEHYLLPHMKAEDKVFNNIYKRIQYCGSYYENLRICDANEFDLNLELKSHTRKEKFLQVCCNDNPPGFVQIRHVSSGDIGKWTDENGYVLQRKVFYWLQSVVDKALHKISDAPWYKITRKTSGPAVTLYVEYPNGEEFSVDLVPVFVFDNNEWPMSPVRQPVITHGSYANEWSVVPKAPSVDNQNVGTFWRMSFYNQEKEILIGKYHLKNAVKLIKMLRDKEGWHCLSSYYIKTVSLWLDMKNDAQFWQYGIGVLLIQMLRALKDHLKIERSIPFFWNERHNLLSSVNVAELEKIGNRLEYILKYTDNNLDQNPYCIGIFFKYAKPQGSELSVFQQSSSPSDDEEEEIQRISLRPQQQASTDWAQLAVGIGAIAIGGAFLYRAFNQNRDQ